MSLGESLNPSNPHYHSLVNWWQEHLLAWSWTGSSLQVIVSWFSDFVFPISSLSQARQGGFLAQSSRVIHGTGEAASWCFATIHRAWLFPASLVLECCNPCQALFNLDAGYTSKQPMNFPQHLLFLMDWSWTHSPGFSLVYLGKQSPHLWEVSSHRVKGCILKAWMGCSACSPHPMTSRIE